MSIALLPPIKPQILEVGHDTDCRRIYTLLSSTQKVAKVQSNTGPNPCNIHILHLRSFPCLPAVRQCVWLGSERAQTKQIRGVVTHLRNEAWHPILYLLHVRLMSVSIPCSVCCIYDDLSLAMIHSIVLGGYLSRGRCYQDWPR